MNQRKVRVDLGDEVVQICLDVELWFHGEHQVHVGSARVAFPELFLQDLLQPGPGFFVILLDCASGGDDGGGGAEQRVLGVVVGLRGRPAK